MYGHLHEGVGLQLEATDEGFAELLEASKIHLHSFPVLLKRVPCALDATVHTNIKVKCQLLWFW